MYQLTRIKLSFPFTSSAFLIIIFFCIVCLCWAEMVGKDKSPPAAASIASAAAVTLPLLFPGGSWHWHLDLWPAAWGGRADGQLEDRHAQLQLQFHHDHQHRFQPGEDEAFPRWLHLQTGAHHAGLPPPFGGADCAEEIPPSPPASQAHPTERWGSQREESASSDISLIGEHIQGVRLPDEERRGFSIKAKEGLVLLDPVFHF